MDRPCSCWIAPKLALHDGHCCFLHGLGDCHEDVLDAADRITGSRDATFNLDDRTKTRLIAEVIDRLYPSAIPDDLDEYGTPPLPLGGHT
ncbi:hypothetical protein [Piscicoccus intestinalis]|uniref:hypothetical protein n=1 Tax=Piscicoccus intestinalis TaxID=746033 RepID=UPI0012EE0709|nr:hypothetical protein [Piscicoccus intestinalis]